MSFPAKRKCGSNAGRPRRTPNLEGRVPLDHRGPGKRAVSPPLLPLAPPFVRSRLLHKPFANEFEDPPIVPANRVFFKRRDPYFMTMFACPNVRLVAMASPVVLAVKEGQCVEHAHLEKENYAVRTAMHWAPGSGIPSPCSLEWGARGRDARPTPYGGHHSYAGCDRVLLSEHAHLLERLVA